VVCEMEEDKKCTKRRASADLDDLMPAQAKRTRTEDASWSSMLVVRYIYVRVQERS
jgi:hypothetical protein